MIIKLLMFVLWLFLLMLLLPLQRRFDKSIYSIAIPYHAPPAWQTLYHSRKIRSSIRSANMAIANYWYLIVSSLISVKRMFLLHFPFLFAANKRCKYFSKKTTNKSL